MNNHNFAIPINFYWTAWNDGYYKCSYSRSPKLYSHTSIESKGFRLCLTT